MTDHCAKKLITTGSSLLNLVSHATNSRTYTWKQIRPSKKPSVILQSHTIWYFCWTQRPMPWECCNWLHHVAPILKPCSESAKYKQIFEMVWLDFLPSRTNYTYQLSTLIFNNMRRLHEEIIKTIFTDQYSPKKSHHGDQVFRILWAAM
jgi:hypothetical protein